LARAYCNRRDGARPAHTLRTSPAQVAMGAAGSAPRPRDRPGTRGRPDRCCPDRRALGLDEYVRRLVSGCGGKGIWWSVGRWRVVPGGSGRREKALIAVPVGQSVPAVRGLPAG
jgi:hypothetical protein